MAVDKVGGAVDAHCQSLLPTKDSVEGENCVEGDGDLKYSLVT